MKRFAIDALGQWKKNDYRKPLIIVGVRQVGKTWLMKEFGSSAYIDSVYIDFSANDQIINDLFSQNLNARQLLMGIETYVGKEIDTDNTLLIFDEIQEMTNALSSLQYIYEDTQNYHIICASSWSDIALYAAAPFLEGKVEILNLYPMSFQEFYFETEQDEKYKNYFFKNNFTMISIFKKKYLDALKNYFFVGGMPESVLTFSKHRDLDKVRDIQKHILDAYEQYFSRYTSAALCSKINLIWKSIPYQLAKENKKFIYGSVQEGGRAKTYQEAISWLDNNKFIYKINRITVPLIPLKDNENQKAFKLFIVDIGLLGCMLGLHKDEILNDNGLFDQFGGALTEQYVLQQLVTIPDWNVHYYANERCACEINCLIDNGRMVVPIEIRTKENLKAKRLMTYQSKFHPEKSVQVSIDDYHTDDKRIRLPFYALEKITTALNM